MAFTATTTAASIQTPQATPAADAVSAFQLYIAEVDKTLNVVDEQRHRDVVAHLEQFAERLKTNPTIQRDNEFPWLASETITFNDYNMALRVDGFEIENAENSAFIRWTAPTNIIIADDWGGETTLTILD